MKNLFARFGTVLGGLLTTVLVVVVNDRATKLTEFGVFNWSCWFAVPVGAVVCGIFAASGYLFGSRFCHQRPSATLWLQMMAIAALAQCSIYWIAYTRAISEGAFTFSDYLVFILPEPIYMPLQNYRGRLTLMGYAMALVQYGGFLLGPIAAFAYLKGKPTGTPGGSA